MATPPDPYRTLGLTRDASIEEVRRAYRRLAKENHPDAAGPAALPRFLAIQAAYERLVEGGGHRFREAEGADAASRRPSAADPARANATHRAYAGRSRRTRPTGSGAGTGAGMGTGAGTSRPPGKGAAGPSPGTGAGTGSASSTGAGSASSMGRRGRGKATLGSTSYDDADAGPFEPDWGGASWYGTTSGTYWTINPKEYADPRKHGPEYQARARRAARAAAVGGGSAPDASATGPATDAPDRSDGVGAASPGAPPDAHDAGRVGPEPSFTRAADPVHTTSSWWDSTGGPAPDEPPVMDRRTPPPPTTPRPIASAADDAQPPDLGAAARQLGRALTDERAARGRWRLAQLLVAWFPLALGVGWAIGELTGCSRSSAACDGADPWIAPAAVVLLLLPLLLVPRLAAIAAAGGIAVAVVAVPAAAILSATHDEDPSTERSVALGLVLLIAWGVGIGIAIGQRVRSRDVPPETSPPGTSRPVS